MNVFVRVEPRQANRVQEGRRNTVIYRETTYEPTQEREWVHLSDEEMTNLLKVLQKWAVEKEHA